MPGNGEGIAIVLQATMVKTTDQTDCSKRTVARGNETHAILPPAGAAQGVWL